MRSTGVMKRKYRHYTIYSSATPTVTGERVNSNKENTIENKKIYDEINMQRRAELNDQKNQEEFGQIIDDKTGLRVFIHMFGNMDNPTIEWDQDAKKEQARENRDAAKQDAKSILKTEFGLFKNDSTVKTYQPIKQQKEELKMEFGPGKKEEPIQDTKKVKKDSKFSNALKKMKEESEKEKKEEFEDL